MSRETHLIPSANTIRKLVLGFILAMSSMARTAFAGSQSSISTKAAFGLATYKSKMLQSNDTGFTIGYGFRVSSGGDQGVDMGLEREQSAFTFALNNSTLALQLQDVDLTYRWGSVYLGLMFVSGSWYAKAPADANGDGYLDNNATAQEYLDTTDTGYGLRTGLAIPIAKHNSIYTDVRYGTITKIEQATPKDSSTAGVTGTSPALGRTVAMGPRMAIDIGTSIALTRDVLSFVSGYKYRTYKVTIEGQSFSELHTSTYLGLQADWSF
jgi:hypothetical protein